MTQPSEVSPRGGTTAKAAARIFVVEDGLIMARDIERRLTTMGYRIAGVATTGEEAVRKVMETRPDLILMDVHLMGPVDGIQAAEQIRQGADIPIVYVTAYSDEATLRRARMTEPFGYVLKPFEERELRTTIEIALYRHGMDMRLRESEKRYRAIAEMSPAYAYSVAVRPDGSFSTEWVTDEFSSTGLPADALANLPQHVHPDDNPVLKSRLRHLLSGEHNVAEYRIVEKSGESRWWLDHARPFWDEAKQRIVRIMGAAHDITERKRAQERATAAAAAQASPEGRIRRSLQNQIHGLEGILDVLAEPRVRVATDSNALASRLQNILHVYAMVYSAEKSLPVEDYVRALTARTFKEHAKARLTYTVDARGVTLDADRICRVLLILQELLCNALRHAHKDGARGEIAVEFGETTGGNVVLRVADDGLGIRKDVDLRRPKTAGLRLVNHLVRQLNGTLEFERFAGTTLAVSFPLHS